MVIRVGTLSHLKRQAFFQFFLDAFSKSTLNFEVSFSEKKMTFIQEILLMTSIYFRNYALRKTWLDICPKSPVSKDPLTGNMVKRVETLHGRFISAHYALENVVTIFSDQF